MKVRANKASDIVTTEHGNKVKERKQKFQNVFCCETGDEVLRDLIGFAGFNQVAYRPGGDTNDMVFLEGQRAIIKYILDQLDYDITFNKKSDSSV